MKASLILNWNLYKTLWVEDFELPLTNNNCKSNLRPTKSKLIISRQFKNI